MPMSLSRLLTDLEEFEEETPRESFGTNGEE